MHICGSMMSLFSACPATPGRLGVGGMLYLAVITVTCLRSCGRWRGFAIEVEEIWSGMLHIAGWKGGW